MNMNHLERLRCPHCARQGLGALEFDKDSSSLVCTEYECARRYPVYEGIPILLTERADFLGFASEVKKARSYEGDDR